MHVIGPELGLTQPGMTIACGDSHTSTHGAFGAIAFGIGTSQVRDVLASQCLAIARPKVRRIEVTGELRPGVYAKDVILHIIRKLGVKGGVGYAYEYAGAVIERMSMEERMTVCNMSIEGGARVGYVNPDADHVRVPARPALRAAGRGVRARGRVVAEHRVATPTPRSTTTSSIDGSGDRADRHLGHQSRPGDRRRRELPRVDELPETSDRSAAEDAYRFMGLDARAGRSRARRSTSPSSARAPTGASAICARPRGSRAAARWRRA